jgi:ATP-dependent RNA helicase RhlE
MSFSSFGLNDRLTRATQSLGFEQPTPIQREALPPALAGRDVLACAMTGSGKTAAFALPILQRLIDMPRRKTRALILTPTRELAAQIEEHMRALGRHTNVGTAAIFGGVGMAPQEQAFRRGVDVIVATPGRLLDHLSRPYARLDAVEVLVLDEADRMLDMGFLPDVKRILQRLPRQRQTLFFSATLPAPIIALSREMLRDPATIAIERGAAPATGVTQHAYPVPAGLKSALLAELVKRGDIRSVIAFTRTKHRANRLAEFLERNGVPAGRIHGNRSQSQRTQALEAFKAGKFRVLVATDIAARGIDVEALSHVVNFDVPASPEDYVHRVGRTARASATGDALLFVSPEDETNVRGIERAIGKVLPRLKLEGFDYTHRPAERLELPAHQRRGPAPARRPHAARSSSFVPRGGRSSFGSRRRGSAGRASAGSAR